MHFLHATSRSVNFVIQKFADFYSLTIIASLEVNVSIYIGRTTSLGSLNLRTKFLSSVKKSVNGYPKKDIDQIYSEFQETKKSTDIREREEDEQVTNLKGSVKSLELKVNNGLLILEKVETSTTV